MRERRAALYALGAALAASAAPATAQGRSVAVAVPAGPLAMALATLAAQTGTSFSLDGPLTGRRVAAVKGRMTAEAAYARLLAGTGLAARRVGAATFRISAARPTPRETSPPGPTPPPVQPDIVVTARKVRERLSEVPGPVAVHVPDGRAASGSDAGTSEVAAEIEGLVATNAGPGASRLFLRGVADSPFVGFGQSPVSIHLNEARITYDAPDPDLRMVDIARVEVLKGPQGPLYGTGALGGVYRVVSETPDLASTSGRVRERFAILPGHGIGGSAEAVANAPIVPGRAALRLVGYTDVAPGWIDNARGRSDVNQILTVGARASLRVVPADGWTLDLVAAGQDAHARDSQYVDRDREDLTRGNRLPEPRSNDVRVVSGVLQADLGARTLTIATSLSRQRTSRVDDASAAAGTLGLPAPLRYAETRRYRVFDQEVRLASGNDRMPWTVGASYLTSSSRAMGVATPIEATPTRLLDASRNVTEAAVFAETSRRLGGAFRMGLGLRVFRSTVEEDREDETGTEIRSKTFVGVSPSATLSWMPRATLLGYLRVASALRPGGLDPSNTVSGRYDADELIAVETGLRHGSADGRLLVEIGAFRSVWSDLQSDYLLPSGLVATRNAGDAEILGADLSIRWQPSRAWSVTAGASGQRARLVRGIDGSDLERDPRLPVVPDMSAHLNIRRSIDMRAWRFSPGITGRYVGRSRLSFDPGLDRRMGGFAEFAASIEARAGRFALELSATNLLDARGDALAFGNPFSVRLERQYTPVRPRALQVSLARDF